MNIQKSPPDYYKILNLPFGSTEEVIKKTFRELAKQFHPDNHLTGNQSKFVEIHAAYRILSTSLRSKYDLIYKKYHFVNHKTIFLPQDRIVYTSSLTNLAKQGLLRVGLRTKDRKKWTGIHHDLEMFVKKSECSNRILIKVPLTVRILCPSCLGSDIYCESCHGIGTYKSTRNLNLSFSPELLIPDKIYELELSRFRPDKFIHFKKKKLKIRIHIF